MRYLFIYLISLSKHSLRYINVIFRIHSTRDSRVIIPTQIWSFLLHNSKQSLCFILFIFFYSLFSGCWFLDKPGYGKTLVPITQESIEKVPEEFSNQGRIDGILSKDVRVGLVSGLHRAQSVKCLIDHENTTIRWIPLYLFKDTVGHQVEVLMIPCNLSQL